MKGFSVVEEEFRRMKAGKREGEVKNSRIRPSGQSFFSALQSEGARLEQSELALIRDLEVRNDG